SPEEAGAGSGPAVHYPHRARDRLPAPSRRSGGDRMSSASRDNNETHGAGLELREMRHGLHPGDLYVRIPRTREFRRVATGRYEVRRDPTRASGLLGLYTRM